MNIEIFPSGGVKESLLSLRTFPKVMKEQKWRKVRKFKDAEAGHIAL